MKGDIMSHFEVFKRPYALSYRWYWRLVASNGRIVADGAQGYKRKENALKGLRVVKSVAYHAQVNFL